MPNNHALPTVLEEIVTARRGHLSDIAARISHVDAAALQRSDRSFFDALAAGGRGNANFILECKSSSPSLGLIREHYQPGAIARIYSRYASAISVLCEPDRFGGDYDHLATVREATHLPVLCKDFIIDPVQIHAARYFGADAILLMLSVLDDEEYRTLATEAERLGLDVLTEVIDEEEVARAIRLGAKIFGINNRNLHDLSIDLSRTPRLEKLIPADAVVISESGIRTVQDVRTLGGYVNGFLVGSQLTSQPDVDLAARTLIYGPNKVCGLTTGRAAQAARSMGAIYGGLIFDEGSPRNLTVSDARAIIAAEPDLHYVAVSRQTTGWDKITADLDIQAIQIHAPYQGSVDAELALIAAIRAEVGEGIEIWRAVSMTDPTGAATAQALAAHMDKLILDTGAGGTGESFDWSTIPEEVAAMSLLAGGLGPDNIAAALNTHCLGVDLNSQVEYPHAAGQWAKQKDAAALRDTFHIIRRFHYAPTHSKPTHSK